MNRLQLALDLRQADARSSELAGMARFGINPEARLGLLLPAMRRIAKTFRPDHELALALWETGIADARATKFAAVPFGHRRWLGAKCPIGLSAKKSLYGVRPLRCWLRWPCMTKRQWIAADALRELTSEAVLSRLLSRQCANPKK